MFYDGFNFKMIRGDSESIVIERVSLEEDSEEPVNFDFDDKLVLTVRTRATSNEKILHKVITGIDGNVAVFPIYPRDTEHLKFRRYVYDIEFTSAEGVVTTYIPQSTFEICKEVSYE